LGRSKVTPWDLNKTYLLVRSVFGRDQERLVRESARSVTDRQSFYYYHFAEAMRLSKTFERNHLVEARTILELHVEGAEKKERAFQVYMVKAGAHSLAAVQSLHAIPDILAHAVYFAAGQNLQPHALDEPGVSLPSVAECLKKNKRFVVLSAPLQSLQSGSGWRHLAAVSNMSKHRSVVRAAYNEDWTGKRAKVRELHVSAFERHSKQYPAVALRELLEPEHERIMKTVISIGNELNACLRSAATQPFIAADLAFGKPLNSNVGRKPSSSHHEIEIRSPR
jgi:hypothetical protein